MLLNIFDSIDLTVENNFKKYYHWRLPRSVGATTYIANHAVNASSKGKEVIVISRTNHLERISPVKYNTYDFHDISYNIIPTITGKRYDCAYIDTIEPFINEKEIQVLKATLQNITKNYILHIESTNG